MYFRWSKKCAILSGVVVCLLIFYIPTFIRWLYYEDKPEENLCHSISAFDDLTSSVDNFDAYISEYRSNSSHTLIFVGNGYLGIPLNEKASIYAKRGRSLSVAIKHDPNVAGLPDSEATILNGKVALYEEKGSFYVSVVTEVFPSAVTIAGSSVKEISVLTSVAYSFESSATVQSTETEAISALKSAKIEDMASLRNSHVDVWGQLWNSGLSVSYSKAQNALNGDVINATIYYVLSSVRAFYHERETPAQVKSFVAKSLSYVEGCYASNHHTLEAQNLWSPISSMESLNNVAGLWILTLEKQGCHNLVQAGADGVAQAMVLSFGSFRFNKQHLECNMHPKFLHRTFHFRRINYGNETHLNITIDVEDDYKTAIYVALDRSDRTYYGCDGGCLNEPVKLGPEKQQFPVKLTEPFTAILYITSDKQHMIDLKHTLHLRTVEEAPPQEKNVITIHQHGSHLSGLPALFWYSVCVLIVIFHLFLIKLVYNECGGDKFSRKR